MDIVLGISITGDKINRLMALLTIVSFYENTITKKINIKIASDNFKAFNEIKNIVKIIYKNKETRIEYVKPSNIYKNIAPPLKQNYATYWKFDLFRDLKKMKFYSTWIMILSVFQNLILLSLLKFSKMVL